MKSNVSNADPTHAPGPGDLSTKAPGGLRRFGSNGPAGLILLGTVHSDPKGFSRTRAFLETYGPDLLLVEISPFALQFRKERSAELRKTFIRHLEAVCQKLGIEPKAARRHAQIASILRQIAVPFEYRASAAFAKRAGVDVIAADYSGFSRRWINTWPEMISAPNIEQLFNQKSTSPSVSSLYAQAARRICGESFYPEIPRGCDALDWQEREEHMAAQILSALQLFHPVRPVYIGGWWHLSCRGSIRTVREILKLGIDSCLLLDRGPLCANRSRPPVI